MTCHIVFSPTKFLRDFEASAEFYVEMSVGYPYREGLVQFTLSAGAMNEAKSIYYAEN